MDRLEALPAESLVYVFSHGQFIQAIRSLAGDHELSDREKMRKFWGKGSPAIANAERVQLMIEAGVWRDTVPQDQDCGLLVQSSAN